jgi:hypothetical protein
MSDETEDFYRKWIKETSKQLKEQSDKMQEENRVNYLIYS